MKYSAILASTIVLVNAVPNSYPAGCAYDSCLWKDKIPAKWKPAASKYCKSLIGSCPPASTTTVNARHGNTVTQTVTPSSITTTTITQTVTPQSISITATNTATATTTATSTITA